MSDYTRRAMAEARHRLGYRPAAPAQSDSADFLGQMRATEFLGGPSALAQSSAEPVAVTDEMVMAACDVLFERTSIAFGGKYMREALEAALDPKQVGLYTAAPTSEPDRSNQ